MRVSHGGVSLIAVAMHSPLGYRVLMNSTLFLQNRSDTPSTSIGGHDHVFDEVQAIKRKALERWENEGGWIPELAMQRISSGDETRRFAERGF